MFAFGYALVPFYDKICRVTGLRDIARPDEVRNTQVDATRTVKVELDANTRGLPWRFRPLETAIDVHPGAVNQVEFEIVNETGRPVIGQAIPSYAPRQREGSTSTSSTASASTTHTLKPGESRQWPVVFVIDPKLPRDVRTITLSYTLFEVGGKTPAEPST